ncbi:ras and Rab interactor 2 [Sardina pilchardus]|uniref:ras and Rab interactor 2 n=1 Tax=Sardina pilchardus TaxID=27697 RepID=UPI002E134DD3
MSASTLPCQPCQMDRSGSFFKLIDTFSSEISELKQEMAPPAAPVDREPETTVLRGLENEVSGLFLQAADCAGAGGARDSGYDSLRRRLSVLDRLTQTHAVWLQLSLGDDEARRILLPQPPGTFLVRKSQRQQRKVISLRMEASGGDEEAVRDFPIKESQYTFSLEGSGISFADLFRLVAFCCISRDVLPFTLKLPEAISTARSPTDLEAVAKLGIGFWDSDLCNKRKEPLSQSPSALEETTVQQEGQSSTPTDGTVPGPHARTPPHLERSQSKGALCFINPLFQHQADTPIPECPAVATALPTTASDPQLTDSGAPLRNGTSSGHNGAALSRAKSVSRTPPPPRPPPPRSRSVPRRPAPPRQRSMPETASWITPPQKEKTSLLGRLGSSFSSSLSFSSSSASSPPKRISAPIPVPSSSSSSSSRGKKPPAGPDVDGHRCHLALDDQTIEQAVSLSLAKLSQRNASSVDTASPSPNPSPLEPGQGTGVRGQRLQDGGVSRTRGNSERLSDISFSTSSSDSLDFSNGFPLTVAGSSKAGGGRGGLAGDSSMEEEEDDDDEELDGDYGPGPESDQELRPPFKAKKRPSAGTFVLPRALRGHLRKVSGVFSSLMTPERRAVRRVVEQAHDKGTYFGCLVQDHVSFLLENGGLGHTSGTELLQTLRQFMTQMKSYLLQSSELDPPIESLVPEDQIDQVLEKAMHKCVLKPLKATVEAALHDFQVKSGAWQQLKENLALAKARQPQEMGVDGALPPDPVAIEKIRHKFHTMHKMYSPEKKVALLLRVCKLIYTIMEDHSGRMYGADDFLPMLTYVLAQCDMPQLDTEIQYMMELLDPSLLQGEGGYYLTSAYGAMSLIRNFQEEQAARILSSETRNTLHQWHRRRTAQRTTPSVDDFQNYLRVALQEVDSGCTAKTLMVHPYATTEEVCQICAEKFKVSDPENHALFLLTEETTQQLAPDTHPQKIKAEVHSRPQVQPFYFVYRRAADLNEPTDDQLNGNCEPN